MRNKGLTEKEKETGIHLLHATDMSIKSIAKRLNCDQTIVGDLNKENGYIRPPKSKGPQGKLLRPEVKSFKFLSGGKNIKGNFL